MPGSVPDDQSRPLQSGTFSHLHETAALDHSIVDQDAVLSAQEIELPVRDLQAYGALLTRHTTPGAQLFSQVFQHAPVEADTTVEITLDPEELGRVRIGLIGGENSGTVILHIERPETLELFRRNLENLRAELQEAGWDSVEFSFDQSSTERDPNGQPSDSPVTNTQYLAQREDKLDFERATRNPETASPSSGLDIRV